MIALALLLQAAAPDGCAALISRDPAAAEQRAAADRSVAGRVCLGVALARQERFVPAAGAFEEAARAAEIAKDVRVASYWAQAGNAWLAAGDAARARTALDEALASNSLSGNERGEAALDRARALVTLGDLKAARADLDVATADAADDPLAWLLSATLARRMDDLPRARTDIAQALRRSADDAQVQLEAGNIAARDGNAAGAQAAWREAARLAPDAPAGRAATQALSQFGADAAG